MRNNQAALCIFLTIRHSIFSVESFFLIVVLLGCEECDDAAACGFLGAITERGWGGIRRDKRQAGNLYSRSCQYGFFEGCALLFEFQQRGQTSDIFSLEATE